MNGSLVDGCTARGYEVPPRRRRHTAVTDAHMLGLAAVLVVAVWQGAGPALAGAAVVWLVRAPRRVVVVAVVLALAGGWWGQRAWDDAQPRRLGPWSGWATLASDPVAVRGAVRVTLEVEGERLDAWTRGTIGRRLAQRQAGDVALVDLVRNPLEGSAARRAAVRHVVGEADIEVLADLADGDALARASNRVRSSLRHAAERSMAPDDATLFTGLVVGDDTRQPPGLVAAFRGSGLSHLTAVSGQNVAFVLAAAGPLLRRLRPWPRWSATVGLIGWFMAVTRFEPSVLRAGAMAALAATAMVTGRSASAVRLVAGAVIVVVALDPLLVWSVGFWLSVGATLGVSVAGPRIERLLPLPAFLAVPLGVTLGAQVGVALPSLLVFGRLPLVSVPANLVAVPVAGFVMLYGLPAGLVAAALPEALGRLLLLPAAAGTRWVSLVARAASSIEPPPAWSIAGWCAVVAVLAAVAVRRARRSP